MAKKNKRKAQNEPEDAPHINKRVVIADTNIVTDPETLKRTILAPFYNRINSDYNTILGLKNELRSLRQGDKSEQAETNICPEKLPHTHPLATQIRQALDEPASDETIHLCGLAPLRIIARRPKDVLALAEEKLHTWAYDKVPTCWRRLYEDACLYIVVDLFDLVAANFFVDNVDRIATIVEKLDAAVVVAGAPGRKDLIDDVLKQLEDPACHTVARKLPQRFQMTPPAPLQSQCSIARASHIWPIDSFQLYLKGGQADPIIIPNAFLTWPAIKLWHDPNYLKKQTLNGHRIVPVEIGSHYLDSEWTQKLIPFGDFLDHYLIPENPKEIGYLAQHDVFAQIPSLRNDINIPDYCYTAPPSPTGAAANTAGLDKVQSLDEPLVNAWLGPKGTKTPLHADPYHNIFCQVVGYKYVRLYAPDQTDKLYPTGTTEAGINMSNTSQVDVSQFTAQGSTVTEDEKAEETQLKFPLFREAEYKEAILGPGECLYIPLGYWHYVESLTTSFSVSFWFN